jgi:hypothetical protein
MGTTSSLYLHLVLFSHSPVYDCMYNVTRQYYRTMPNVTTVYYTFAPELSAEYEMRDDILYIRGEETYVPGILVKTVKALAYFRHARFDYVVRSNISSVVNFTLLDVELGARPVHFDGGEKVALSKLIPESGIVDSSLFGSPFFCGTCIVMSPWAVDVVLANEDFLRFDIVDDVALGVFFYQYFPQVIGNGYNSRYVHVSPNTRIPDLHVERTLVYRNRNDDDRDGDCTRMQHIVNILRGQSALSPLYARVRI